MRREKMCKCEHAWRLHFFRWADRAAKPGPCWVRGCECREFQPVEVAA